jgi:hypothetical protein
MLLTFALVAALAAPADSVSGTWVLKGEVAGNPLNTTCTLVVAEAKISGVCKSAEGKDSPITGRGEGRQGIFEHGGDYNARSSRSSTRARFPPRRR